MAHLGADLQLCEPVRQIGRFVLRLLLRNSIITLLVWMVESETFNGIIIRLATWPLASNL